MFDKAYRLSNNLFCHIQADAQTRADLAHMLGLKAVDLVDKNIRIEKQEIVICDYRTEHAQAGTPTLRMEGQHIAIVNNEEIQIERAIANGATQFHFTPIDPKKMQSQLRLAVSLAQSPRALSCDKDTRNEPSEFCTESSIRQTISRWNAEGTGQPVIAMLIGIRRLDAVNTTYGSCTGDAALVEIARRLEAVFTSEDLPQCRIGRLSGSAFLILVCGLEDRALWQSLAEQAVARVADSMTINRHPVRVTARAALGLLKLNEDGHSFIDRLFTTLLRAQKRQTNEVLWADRESDYAPENGHKLAQDIVHSVERDEIRIVFQPQFAVADRRLTGAEALARWEHPSAGEIGAGTLFAIADKADFTRQLSEHIRDKALQFAADWPVALSNLRLSINVTAQDIATPGFVKNMANQLAQSRFPKDRLTLEITESVLVPNLKKAAQTLREIRDIGVRIAVDDFGTGYSNLLYLKSLPLDYLKLDHAMTRDISGEPRDRIIVRSMVALGRALGLEIIAEGVETDAQLAALHEEGCDYFQGFLISPALDPADFEDFALRSN